MMFISSVIYIYIYLFIYTLNLHKTVNFRYFNSFTSRDVFVKLKVIDVDLF